jgi:hypothetical protein
MYDTAQRRSVGRRRCVQAQCHLGFAMMLGLSHRLSAVGLPKTSKLLVYSSDSRHYVSVETGVVTYRAPAIRR